MSAHLLKKGQNMILENIPFIAIVLLLIIGYLMFSTQLKSKDLQAEQAKMNSLQTGEIAQTILSINKLQCSIESFKEDSCIDYFKLQSVTMDPVAYFDLLGYSTIKVSYKTLSGTVEEKVIYDHQKKDYQTKNVFFTPVIVYNADAQENYFGILNVEVYT